MIAPRPLQAFPGDRLEMQQVTRDLSELVRVPDPGMTLRDWFAGQALPALIAQIYAIGGCADGIAKPVAEIAYEIADAMLSARGGA